MYSSGLSSVQRLDNGNTLICSAQKGYTFEITPTEEIVWEYVTPLKLGVKVKQGDTSLNPSENNTFRVNRYAFNHPAFSGKNLSPKGFMELNPDTFFCELPVADINKLENSESIKVFPNPVNNLLDIEISKGLIEINSLVLYSITGEIVMEAKNLKSKNYTLNLSDVKNGLYFISINKNKIVKKLEVMH